MIYIPNNIEHFYIIETYFIYIPHKKEIKFIYLPYII